LPKNKIQLQPSIEEEPIPKQQKHSNFLIQQVVIIINKRIRNMEKTYIEKLTNLVYNYMEEIEIPM
jgi:hypothetical protein